MKNVILTALIGGALVLTGCVSVIDSGNAVTEPTFSKISSMDKRKIEAAVYDYFDGQGQASFERLDRAFSDKAAMYGVRKGENGNEYLRVWPDMNKVIQGWGSNKNPAGDRDSEILAMNVTDGRIATVHFRSADRFYDVLTLVKIDGEWEIATKVFVNQ